MKGRSHTAWLNVPRTIAGSLAMNFGLTMPVRIDAQPAPHIARQGGGSSLRSSGEADRDGLGFTEAMQCPLLEVERSYHRWCVGNHLLVADRVLGLPFSSECQRQGLRGCVVFAVGHGHSLACEGEDLADSRLDRVVTAGSSRSTLLYERSSRRQPPVVRPTDESHDPSEFGSRLPHQPWGRWPRNVGRSGVG